MLFPGPRELYRALLAIRGTFYPPVFFPIMLKINPFYLLTNEKKGGARGLAE